MSAGVDRSRIVHLPGRSLNRDLTGRMVQTMFGRFARQFGTLFLALGVFLSAAAPSWAMPAVTSMSSPSMTMMSGMAMSGDCMAAMERGPAHKSTPCKSSDMGCAVCTACALPVATLQELSPIRLLENGESVFAEDVNRNSIAVLPALPPPIVHV